MDNDRCSSGMESLCQEELPSRDCRVLRELHDLSTRSPSLTNNADDPDELSDSSSPWSTSSEIRNLHRMSDVRGEILSKADDAVREMGDRVPSQSSLRLAIKGDIIEGPSLSFCHETGRLNTGTMNVSSARIGFNAMGPGLETCNRDIQRNKSDKIKSVFQCINAHEGQEVEIGAILKPFIPNYILAVGVIDEFIKVPRPDKKPDLLGFEVLDESGANQSDLALTMLQLYATSRQPSLHMLEVLSIENASQNSQKMDAWITNIKGLHCTKPSSCVVYSKVMPYIEKLVLEWPMHLEKVLIEIEQPTSKLDVDLAAFVDICCSILDIPISTADGYFGGLKCNWSTINVWEIMRNPYFNVISK